MSETKGGSTDGWVEGFEPSGQAIFRATSIRWRLPPTLAAVTFQPLTQTFATNVIMPWTRRQVKYLLSKGSPLSGSQKTKMVGELHENPAMGHAKKGSQELKAAARERMNSEIKNYRGKQSDHSSRRPVRKVRNRYA